MTNTRAIIVTSAAHGIGRAIASRLAQDAQRDGVRAGLLLADVHGASKAAALMLMRQTALDWGPDGIRANAISPGLTQTPGTASLHGVDLVVDGGLSHALMESDSMDGRRTAASAA